MVVGKILVQNLMSKAIKTAKKRMEKKYCSDENCQKWLETLMSPYGDDAFMIRLYILEGKPPKGYILADYSSGIVRVFGENLKTLFTIKAS